MARARLRISTFLMAVLLAALVSFSAVMCLADAFSLQHSMTGLAAACGTVAMVCACILLPRKSGITSLAALALLVGWIVWKRQPMEESLMALLHGVTAEYALCYSGVAVIGAAGDCTTILTVVAVPLCWITAWVICKEGSVFFPLLMCAPILVICLIIVELAPVFWLILLTFSLLVLLLSHSVRERSANEGGRLAWWILLPAVIWMGAVTIIWPPADYERADWSQSLQEAAESGFQKETLEELTQSAVSAVINRVNQQEKVDLSRLGPMRLTGTPVMECFWPEQKFYLRGVSYGVYSDNEWSALDGEVYASVRHKREPLIAVGSLGYISNLQIRTNRAEEVLYTTYFLSSIPRGAEFEHDSYVRNVDRMQEYEVYCSTGIAVGGETSGEYNDYVNQYYTQVPDELRAGLEEFLEQKGWSGTKDPELLVNLVRNSGVYDLNTPRLPAGEEFVLYFLQESNRGYCVHFATAATMLLRTAGIPARYVTGYSVTGNGTDWVTVTEDDAHAWVEYYVNSVGWLPLDPTPAADETQAAPGIIPEQVQQQQQQGQNMDPEEQPETTEPETLQEEEKPAQQKPAEQEQQKTGSGLWWLVLPIMVLAVLLRRWMVVRGRNRRCSRGLPNRQALGLWRWLVVLGKHAALPPEEELFRLAEKARFSQHTLTEEELGLLRQAAERRIDRLQQLPAWRQFWLQYGLVLY